VLEVEALGLATLQLLVVVILEEAGAAETVN
jgi:hypothetical protein